jgi:CheY-like chemotaxis protein
MEKLRAKSASRELPVIVYTGKDLTPEDEEALRKYAQSVILKSAVHSPERLLSETALFLHRVESQLPERSKAVLEASRHSDASVAGRKVLVVDDDVRNIFAMTSVLEASGLQVIYAENGQAGIEALTKDPAIDLVLMDVMMPGIDGYETIRTIRANPIFRGIPIVAVTAKALKDDRSKCLQAGASDYLPKPVDTEKLLDLIRLWTGGGEGVSLQ